jgi:hypothetical protein
MALCLICVTCARNEHFISDSSYRKTVGQAFEQKKSCFADTTLFAIFDERMTNREREAMQFLYAFMPVGDVTDYDGGFYLDNVRMSFEAKQAMPWGKRTPEDIFRHFVLPVRVNNESLDNSRALFYAELKDRVRTMSMYDAVLEVNHWCHEKVIYMPTDARTCSPLTTVKTAYGRCGEESVFTVAALRAVGIPARQVYTPRWAHTDDNHSWVEAWVDGVWYFLGACEPEPVLNLAWFNSPASRSLLMHTKVFGLYKGPEETVETTACYTEINITGNYAPTAKMKITVCDTDNKPVGNASVEMKIYNYAEFVTVATLQTDAEGQCSFTAGRGDMLVWASKDGKFGFAKASFGTDEQLTVALDKKTGDRIDEAIDIMPPVESNISVEVAENQREENTRRLAEEDALRVAYIETFYTAEQAAKLADELNIDRSYVEKLLPESRGNHDEIVKFLRETPHKKRKLAISLLNSISVKDLHDTPASTLADHLNNSLESADEERFVDYVLNPRVANELLTPYRQFFLTAIDENIRAAAKENPQVWAEWTGREIAARDELNPQLIPVSPVGVWKARTADRHSRDIFFVASTRSMGIPARLDPVSGKPQFYRNGWVDAKLDNDAVKTVGKGAVVASYTPDNSPDNPKYYSHFTLAALQQDGRLRTLNFATASGADMGAGSAWSELLKNPLPLDAGNYVIVSGSRMASGKVLTQILSFTVEAGKTASTSLRMRYDDDDLRVVGTIETETKMIASADGDELSTILDLTGRGYFILGIVGVNQEPTNHALRDIAMLKSDFDRWQRPLVLLFRSRDDLQKFDRTAFGVLPDNTIYGVDPEGKTLNMIAISAKLPEDAPLPVFIVADTFGRVVFVSQGYTIGLGEQLIKVTEKLK